MDRSIKMSPDFYFKLMFCQAFTIYMYNDAGDSSSVDINGQIHQNVARVLQAFTIYNDAEGSFTVDINPNSLKSSNLNMILHTS